MNDKVFPMYGIDQENWNPRIHYDDANALSDESSHAPDIQEI